MRIVKLFFRVVVIFILILITIFLGLYWYGNTAFYQSGHLKKQIESDFNLSLSEKPSIIDIDGFVAQIAIN